MPRKKRRPRAVIASVAPYRPPRFNPIAAAFGLAWWAIKAVVGLWALYWFFVIVWHLIS